MKTATSSATYIEKIKPVLRKFRFSQMKMDDIARHMDISKVTMYKHFASRDDVIRAVVGHYADYLLDADAAALDGSRPFAERFRRVFETSLRCVVYVSDLFLQDLKDAYPALWEELLAAQQRRYRSLEAFFEDGIGQGFFNPINATLYLVQDDATLRQIVDPSFSIKYDLTAKQALMDYYRSKKYQLFRPAHLDDAEDAEAEKEIAQILQAL
ncbi:TetR/AcrR family transcriptional regulator [Cohnella sp. REN36]|uniref:TetR/AcrR family transcriptional regulator n=1 Tax=Cohnella sp. REN36 TaxID=2887347 RepID=UPI001D14F54B|nr:TetR/AcrR family transcriptional regulator [Cohnella sp. REN36]MCC3375067.1 TetR/AcrR family transcriptional regulator [Cohnella sp. REN36]